MSTITITKWPHQSEAVGAAAPTRGQLRLQRQTKPCDKDKVAATKPPQSLASQRISGQPILTMCLTKSDPANSNTIYIGGLQYALRDWNPSEQFDALLRGMYVLPIQYNK
jgi:hypothetical protein